MEKLSSSLEELQNLTRSISLSCTKADFKDIGSLYDEISSSFGGW